LTEIQTHKYYLEFLTATAFLGGGILAGYTAALQGGLGVVGYLHLVDHLAASKEVVGSIPAALKLPYYFIQK
jgi:hypothetical protein